jgi:hypothetical protein
MCEMWNIKFSLVSLFISCFMGFILLKGGGVVSAFFVASSLYVVFLALNKPAYLICPPVSEVGTYYYASVVAFVSRSIIFVATGTRD